MEIQRNFIMQPPLHFSKKKLNYFRTLEFCIRCKCTVALEHFRCNIDDTTALFRYDKNIFHFHSISFNFMQYTYVCTVRYIPRRKQYRTKLTKPNQTKGKISDRIIYKFYRHWCRCLSFIIYPPQIKCPFY